MRVRTGCVIISACLALSGCGSTDEGEPSGTGFPPSTADPVDDTTEDAGAAALEEDTTDSGAGDEDTLASTDENVIVDTTLVEYVGIKGAEQAVGLLCGGESVEILVRAVDIGSRPLRLAIVKAPNTYVLPIDSTSEGDDIYAFAFNTLPLTIPDDGLPSKDDLDPDDPDDAAQIASIDMMILEAGKSMTLEIMA
jgi:hypothetical protein